MARFCWRERSERVNWRLLRGLQLTDIVRRGDPTLLEPYALHLTFARLPVTVQSLGSGGRHDEDDALANSGDGAGPRDAQGPGRNAWFVVRVLQLSMEYLLFLRARDGAVVDSLREELLVCERECELLVERAGKWKERSRSGERQVEKLHQVLQNVAKLLQIEGATPSAVSTIESLLRDLVPRSGRRDKAEPSASHVEEARVCALCGKMFSSQEYLDKHAVRRHPGVDMTTARDVSGKKNASRGAKMPVRDAASNQGEAQVDHANDMKAMLRAVEETLHEHQSKLRTVAQEEADKLHNLYEQLHVETQLAEEMRVKRAAVERDVKKRQRELEAIEQEKEDLTEELRVMKEQLEFLAMKRKIEAQNGVTSLPTSQPDPTLQLEMKRLEETIAMLREALSTAREELQRSHETHGALLKEKVTLESQLLESKNHALRLEASLRGAQDPVPPMHVDKDVQAVTSTASSTTQTDEIQVETPEAVVVAPPARVAAGEVAVQTEELDRAERIDMMIQTEPEAIPPPTDLSRTRSPTKSIGISVGTDLAGEDDLDSVFKLKCASILEQVQRRADRAASKTTTAMDQQSDEKIFSSLSRRRYLRSRFLHEERAVSERITSHVGKLEQTSLRYGVSPKSSVLANEHVELVQRALQAHLEVLPAEVLQRMIDIDNSVNTLIQKHWMPQEKSRQQALERLTAGLEAKSQANQGLVRQAMLAFASTTTEDATTEKVLPVAISDQVYPTTNDKGVAPTVTTAPANEASPNLSSADDADPDLSTQSTDKKEEGHVGHDFTTTPQLSDAEPTQTEAASISKQRERETLPGERLEGKPDVPTLAVSEASSTQQQGEPSPVSVQKVRRQAITVRAVTVVSVSPKSSPPRSPPRAPPLSNKQRVEESRRSTPPEGIAVGQESSPAKPAEPRVKATPMHDIEFATTSTDTTAPPAQAVQASGTSVMHNGAPSSFSAKHPESQLGIVIPSRYDPNTITVHGLQNDPDEDSGGRYHDREPTHGLHWSSSAERSVGASERSLSAVESSDMSFDASIPSLGSEGVSMSRSFPRSSVEQLPSVATRDDQPNIPDDASDTDGVTEIPGIESIQEEASDGDEDVVQALATEPIVSQSSEPQRSPRLSPRPNEVMAFDDDDDSDIEEVMLA